MTSEFGILRLSSGGATTSTNKCIIDIISSATDTNRKIKFKVGNSEKMRLSKEKIQIFDDLELLYRKKFTFINLANGTTGQTIGQHDPCNEINGAYSSSSGSGHIRLSAGGNDLSSTKSSIDIYGYGSVSSNRIVTTLENIEVSVVSRFYHDISIPMRTKEINPQISGSYSLGSTNFKWADVWAVNGTIQTSDRNMKENILPIKNGLKTILSLEPVSYKFKDGKRTHTGYIAQDTKDKFCNNWAAYVEDENGCGLRYTELVSINSAAIQDLYSLISSSDKQPILIEKIEKVKSDEHKCNNLELISQLNSYELELLDCNSKVKQLDDNIELLCEDNNILKVKNKGLEERISNLELSNKQLLEKLNNIDNKKDDDNNLLTEDDENSSIMDLMNQRFIDLESRLLKTEKKNAKLVTTINKMLKEK